jgi:uncharacterized membrane protein
MKPSYLLKGLPGHPLHPPLTDATIGAYTVAAIAGVFSKVGISTHPAAYAWWIALVVAICISLATALTGLVDWLGIEWWTPLWRTATLHMGIMLTATGVFAGAVLWGHAGYTHGAVRSGPFALTLIGYGVLALGGWVGGAITFVHGMRVLGLQDEPTRRAISPLPGAKEESAEGG